MKFKEKMNNENYPINLFNEFIKIHSKFIIILFPLFLLPLLQSSVFAADILPNSTLYASNQTQKWSSPKNTFSLLFLPVNPTTFSLCIAYGGSVSIWAPAKNTDENSSFHFLSNGNLQLISGSGELLWQSNTSNLGITHATLEDSGNFILKNGTFSLWHSFKHLTDTLVPSQNFTVSNVLTSRSYSFGINRSGNLTLKWNNSILYWNFGVKLNSSVLGNLSNPNLSIKSNGILALSDPNLSSSNNLVYGIDFDSGNDFRFLRLDDDGNLRIYSANNGNTSVRWTAISDQCEVFGYCGNMGICSYDVIGSPTCSCPSKNFVFVDSNDARKGCKRKEEIKDCPGNETMLQLDHTKFFTFPPETSNDVYIVGTTACRSNCLVSSVCVASSILGDGTGRCYTKTSDFVSAYQSPVIPGSSFVKVCSPAEPNPSPMLGLGTGSDWKLRTWIVVVLAVLGTLLGMFVVGAVIWWSCCRNNPKFGGLSPQYALIEYASGTPVQFSYSDLRKATKGFKEKLGMGGFGAVYRGILSNKVVVAVKQLEGIEQGEKQFRMEVATISCTHHFNLVRLIGFCSEGRHRLLVYEFMRNGSLDTFLFKGEEKSLHLNWEQRFNIVIGTARAITYLHEECRDCIIHCDIKPENILLDENLNAKVSDFGLAKLMSHKDQKARNLTSLKGTRGYLGPEWLANLPITSKSDVYSFGMVMLEIISGRRNFEVSVDTNNAKFSIWTYEEYEKNNLTNIVDKRLNNEFDIEQATRALLVSFWCIQEQPSHRPMMGKVVQMLEGVVPVLKSPPLKATEDDLLHTTNTSVCISATSGARSSSMPKSSASGMEIESPSSILLQGGN